MLGLSFVLLILGGLLMIGSFLAKTELGFVPFLGGMFLLFLSVVLFGVAYAGLNFWFLSFVLISAISLVLGSLYVAIFKLA